MRSLLRVRACVRACVRTCVRACVRVFVRSSLHFFRFGQLLRCEHKRIVNLMKVFMERNNLQVELIRFRKKILTIFRFKTSKRILSRPMCLRMKSHSNVCPFDSNDFKLQFNHFFRIRFQMFPFLTTRRKDCIQLFEIRTFINDGNFELHTFASDVIISKLGSLLSVTCRHCSVNTVRMQSRTNMCMFDKRQFDSNLLIFADFLTV